MNAMDKFTTEDLKPQPYKRWRAENGCFYWSLMQHGRVIKMSEHEEYTGELSGNTLFELGNYFKTKEEAETHKQRLIATQELKDLAEGHEWCVKKNFSIWYNIETGCFEVYNNNKLMTMAVYFASEAKAQHAIDTLGEEKLKLIFNIGGE